MAENIRTVLLEVCVDSLEGAVLADNNGANRIELCSSLLEGGLTPSYGLMKLVRQAVKCRMHVMIRPRGGDFLYTQAELQVMMEDARCAASIGADGLVLGILRAVGTVNSHSLKPFVDFCQSEGLDFTFHRAFDMVSDQRTALHALIECNVPRVLTSGGKSSAMQGAEGIRELVAEAQGRIVIMAAGSIRQGNVRELLDATDVSEVHSSASRSFESGMSFRSSLSMCSTKAPSDWQWTVTDESSVTGLMQELSMWKPGTHLQ